MDILGGLRVQIDTFYYNLLLSIAGLHWSLLRGFIMMGYTIELINGWLAANVFTPLIGQTNNSLNVAVTLAFGAPFRSSTSDASIKAFTANAEPVSR